MITILLRLAAIAIAAAALGLAIAAHSEETLGNSPAPIPPGGKRFAECTRDNGCVWISDETLYQSYPGNNTAMLRGGRVLALMPHDTEVHHVDTSEGYPHLFPGSCIAAPPAKCVLRPEQVEPMQQAPTR